MIDITPAGTIVLTSTLLALALVVATLRLLQRHRTDFSRKADAVTSIVLGSHLDDIFCILGLCFALGIAITILWGATNGVVGAHSTPDQVEEWITSVTPDFVLLEKVVYIVFILQPLAVGFTKLSILFFYRRLFTGKGFKITNGIMITITIAWMICFFFGFVFDCQLDFAANWASLAQISEECGFGFIPTIVYTCADAILDLIVLVMPLPWIFRLQMKMAQKLSIVACFMLGGFAVTAAIIRMVIYLETNTPDAAEGKGEIMGLPVWDVMGIISAEVFWTMVETLVAVIACCLPATRQIISQVFGSHFFSLSFLNSWYYKMSYGRSTKRGTDVELGNSIDTKTSHLSETGTGRSGSLTPATSREGLVVPPVSYSPSNIPLDTSPIHKIEIVCTNCKMSEQYYK